DDILARVRAAVINDGAHLPVTGEANRSRCRAVGLSRAGLTDRNSSVNTRIHRSASTDFSPEGADHEEVARW
ncbi:hypothetical protein ACFWFR_18965, partial [Oerskovia sp. NPDC060287]|uniref:hypothetical protein n=1 Tax=Oerskovia sp. NPDC060287 TaxID=3347095 RepID=UPI00365F06AD